MPVIADPGAKPAGLSICLFCGSSDAADPDFLAAAAAFGTALAQGDVRLVYGGGGVGLMGAAAKAAHAAGGRVLGVMPEFLCRKERVYDQVDTVVVDTMHARKQIMFEQSDAFAVLPGGIGTLEEVVELLSWRRLGLHDKPILFLNTKGFWEPFYDLIRHTANTRLTPPWMGEMWLSASDVAEILPTLRNALAHTSPTKVTAVARQA